VNDYARSLPHLGFDPAPGDVGLTQNLARRHYQVAAEARQVLAMIERLDLHALQGRAADAMRSLQATFPPALRNTASAAETLHAATASWANQLSGFQAESDVLERKAANASAQQQALQAKQAALPPGSAVLTADLKSASAAVSGIQSQAQDLHQRYLAAAAKTAEGVGEHSGLWDRTEPVRTVLEAVLAPLDIVAADHWVGALEKIAGSPPSG
jgi:chromosome segregation ATPase